MTPEERKNAISKKIGILIHVEGKSPEQAAAMAHSMMRAGRLTKDAQYIRKGEEDKKREETVSDIMDRHDHLL